MSEVSSRVHKAGATLQPTSVWNVLSINGSLTLKVTLASNRRFSNGQRRWRVPLSCGARSDFVLCGLLDDANEEISMYLLLAPAGISKASLLLSAKKLPRYAKSCFPSLDAVFGLADPAKFAYAHFEQQPPFEPCIGGQTTDP